MSEDASPRSDALPDSARCPHCGTCETEQFSTFGSALSVSQYYCRRCRTVFEFFKWRGAGAAGSGEEAPAGGEAHEDDGDDDAPRTPDAGPG